MASGNPKELDPGSHPAQIGEGTLETESVSLAVGEGFPNAISLSFSVKSRSAQDLNLQLQEAARKKLWALENDDKDVCAVFKELSARLVCIQAQENRFLLSFGTVEEIWKFSTYLALGYVGCCLEQLLFTPEYWLNCAQVDDTEIIVTVDEDCMATMYLGLLLQEGSFFARATLTSLAEEEEEEEEEEEDLKLLKNELVHVKDIGHETKWEGTSLLTDQRGLISVTTIEPLPPPFYQWFLKNYPISCGISKEISGSDSLQIGQGRCTATEDHRGKSWDELSYCKGDILEVIGFLIPGLRWFIGKSTTSGILGFVQTKSVQLESYESMRKNPVFFSEEEISAFLQAPCNDNEVYYSNLLNEWAQTDITSVYRLDGFEPIAMYPQRPSDAAVHGHKNGWIFEIWGKQSYNSLFTHTDSEKSTPVVESSPFTLEHLLLPEPDDLDDPKFFIDLNAGHMEDCDVFDPILTFLNQDSYVPHFQSLYDLSFSFLSSTFYGFTNEEELVIYLETSRNWAKRGHFAWAHIRICYLLGRLCVRKAKFSQARVYFEEAMNIMDKGFEDLPLLTSLHANLAAIYLKQKMKQKFLSMIGKGMTLLACMSGHCFSSETELEVMMYILREAIAVGNTTMEIRSCFLIVRLFLHLGKYDETDSVTQDGVVHNLLAIALTREGQVQKAAENYLWALKKAQENGNQRNQAIALANFGCLVTSLGAYYLGEYYFLRAIQLYFELQDGDDTQMELVHILLWVAQSKLVRCKAEEGIVFYELALAIALKTQNVISQLHVTESLCHFYSKVHPDIRASIQYHEHHVLLARHLQDREKEGHLLQVLSQLYQSLQTPRSLKQALDSTKQSLRIFIDLEEIIKTAQAWLQAGKLYYQMQENELVEMYLQASIETALKPKELHLAMELYEEAGDVFFNGIKNRHKAVEYYRGGAIPLARKLRDTITELRVFNKLAELQIGLHNYENALEFATLAVRLSVDVGDHLQELVAFHRLATVYYLLQMYEMAEDCYLRTLSLHSPELQGAQEAIYYSKVYYRLGDLTLHKLKDEQDAASYFFLALAAATEFDDCGWQGKIQARAEGRIQSEPL
ncbi:SH3 domain and tetratricopeptide repeat-containing protein 2 [Crotalus adamanteus]|uniref:SH3 domain and tetratricopeptide repeat-containing protein 2 n=1 Tax=Crotalus adamanteus TaxID=8729 RepID=A0AAW1BX67_CROAD